MEQVRVRTRLRRLYTLAPLLVLIVSACAQGGPQAYNGVQARTPVDKIPSGGQMKNFTLLGQNPLGEPKLNVPRGMNGGDNPVRDFLYVSLNNAPLPGLTPGPN